MLPNTAQLPTLPTNELVTAELTSVLMASLCAYLSGVVTAKRMRMPIRIKAIHHLRELFFLLPPSLFTGA